MILRPLSVNDTDALWTIAAEKELWELSLSGMENKNDLIRYIAEALEEKKAGISWPFVIIDKQSGKTAGSTRYGNIYPAHCRLEIGWTWIGREFQGSGLNKACKYELLKYAFENLNANRVEFKADALNLRSRAAILKTGATEEGVFRRHMIAENGRVRDSAYYSIIKEEWTNLRHDLFSEFSAKE